jgi:hypothetical protein
MVFLILACLTIAKTCFGSLFCFLSWHKQCLPVDPVDCFALLTILQIDMSVRTGNILRKQLLSMNFIPVD